LSRSGRADEALYYSRQACRLDPNNAAMRSNTAYMLWQAKKYDEAVVEIPKAIPTSSIQDLLYTVLGHSLLAKERYAEAVTAYQEALARTPGFRDALTPMKAILITRLGRPGEARVAWGNFLRTKPADHAAWDGYAELCLFLGERDEYSRGCRELLDRFGNSTDPQVAERTSRTCLLLPGPAEEVARAAAFIDRAIAAEREKPVSSLLPYFLVTKALAEYRSGRPEEAIALLKGEPAKVLPPLPQLILAMAQHRVGQEDAARKTLATAALSFNWRASDAKAREAWMYHALRREAEQMILPDLPAFLDGKHEPRDNDERLALLGACQFTDRTLALAKLYSDAFVADPSLADDLRAGHRSNAARHAVQAGGGRGADAVGLGEPERAKWRARAREWLRADLTALGKLLDRDPGSAQTIGLQRLTQWQGDPDLAGLRDAAALSGLTPEERKACLAVWDEVETVLGRCKTR
jgi:serine/threonine-protein kinase